MAKKTNKFGKTAKQTVKDKVRFETLDAIRAVQGKDVKRNEDITYFSDDVTLNHMFEMAYKKGLKPIIKFIPIDESFNDEFFSSVIAYATEKHEGQVRKGTNDPYITHPLSVAETVKEYGGTWQMITAAILHDVVEDTDATLEDITYKFGAAVAKLVSEVTKKPIRGNRNQRNQAETTRLSHISENGKLIKLADILDNTKDVEVAFERKFALRYVNEKIGQLETIGSGVEDTQYNALWNVVYDQLTNKKRDL